MRFRLLRNGACALAVLSVLGGPACTYYGRYEVHGSVRRATETEVPFATVSVASRDGKSGWPSTVQADAHGRFLVHYQFGGLFVPGMLRDGDPILRISAAGYAPCEVELRSAGKTRAALGICKAGDRWCSEFNVLLKASGDPGEPGCEY